MNQIVKSFVLGAVFALGCKASVSPNQDPQESDLCVGVEARKNTHRHHQARGNLNDATTRPNRDARNRIEHVSFEVDARIKDTCLMQECERVEQMVASAFKRRM